MNKLQKRELRKKRHKRQQYLKHEAPLDKLETSIGRLDTVAPRCRAIRPMPGEPDVQCILLAGHTESAHEGRNGNNDPVYWRIHAHQETT